MSEMYENQWTVSFACSQTARLGFTPFLQATDVQLVWLDAKVIMNLSLSKKIKLLSVITHIFVSFLDYVVPLGNKQS